MPSHILRTGTKGIYCIASKDIPELFSTAALANLAPMNSANCRACWSHVHGLLRNAVPSSPRQINGQSLMEAS
jgi:hypothetical protein